mmetsp:Transcript_35315/g.87887  ORF Transcript_35315/g.87887 Transcript_35315/m.87887 type:complete len:240 (+) Transcript_35315:400-1119(+)
MRRHRRVVRDEVGAQAAARELLAQQLERARGLPRLGARADARVEDVGVGGDLHPLHLLEQSLRLLPPAGALARGDGGGEGDRVGRHARLLHHPEQLERLLPLPRPRARGDGGGEGDGVRRDAARAHLLEHLHRELAARALLEDVEERVVRDRRLLDAPDVHPLLHLHRLLPPPRLGEGGEEYVVVDRLHRAGRPRRHAVRREQLAHREAIGRVVPRLPLLPLGRRRRRLRLEERGECER